MDKICLDDAVIFMSEKSNPKLWNVSCIKTLNHSSLRNTTISESIGHVVVNAVFTCISSKIETHDSGNVFVSEVK